MTGPFNPAAHEYLHNVLGYSYTHERATEIGTVETGPLGVDPGYDLYVGEHEDVVITQDGEAILNPFGDDPLGDWHGRNE